MLSSDHRWSKWDGRGPRWGKSVWESRSNGQGRFDIGLSEKSIVVPDEKIDELIGNLIKFFDSERRGINVLLILKDGTEIKYGELDYGVSGPHNQKFQFCVNIPRKDYLTGADVEVEKINIESIAKVRRVRFQSGSINDICVFREKGDIGEFRIGPTDFSREITLDEAVRELRQMKSIKDTLDKCLGFSIWVNKKEVADMNIVLRKREQFRKGDRLEIRYKTICE